MGSHNYLQVLQRTGAVGLPPELIGLKVRDLATYAAVQAHEPVCPVRLTEWYDMSPGSMYPAIELLEDQDLIDRYPDPVDPRSNYAETTGPRIAAKWSDFSDV